MADFNRYVVTVDVESADAQCVMNNEVSFSVAAVSESTVPSALPLKRIPHVSDYEILEIKEQNQ